MNRTILSAKRQLTYSLVLSTLLVSAVFSGCDSKTQMQEEKSQALKPTNSSTPAPQHAKTEKSAVVATVNGVALYEDKLNVMVQKQLKKDRRYIGSKPSQEQKNLLKQKILNKMINDEVLRQASLKEPVENLTAKIQSERASIEKKFGSKEAFNNYVTSMGMNTSEFNNFLKEKIHLQEYFRKHRLNNPDIPEEEIRNFYDKGKQNFSRETMVSVSQILLGFDHNTTAQHKEIVFKKATEIRNMLRNGHSFATLAQQYSQSAEANESNGSLGFIKKGYMPEAFEQVMYSLKEGDISDPVPTQFGYHIIKVDAIEPAHTAPYEEVRDFIKKYLQERIIVNNTLSHVKELRDASDINIPVSSS